MSLAGLQPAWPSTMRYLHDVRGVISGEGHEDIFRRNEGLHCLDEEIVSPGPGVHNHDALVRSREKQIQAQLILFQSCSDTRFSNKVN